MKKKYLIFVFVLSVIVTQNVSANRLLLENNWSLEEYQKLQYQLNEIHRTKKQTATFQAGDSTNSYDVLHYDIYMDWYNILHYGEDIAPEDKYWLGRTTITLQSNIDGLSVINLDAVDLEIEEVFVSSGFLDYQYSNNILSISLYSVLDKGEQAVIEITYKYNKFENIGFNLYYKGDVVNNITTNENIAYTVNSPEFARYWFPCNDTPRDKAGLTMRVLVPLGYTVASNGMLVEKIDTTFETGESYTTFLWADTTPIATFLINAVASKFVEYTELFSPNPNAAVPDSLEIINYVWEDDLEGNSFSAKNALRRQKEILEYFSVLFGDYPFCKYGTVEVYPFLYAAMENQTMTNLSKQIYRTNYDGLTVPHEIGHHWFGNYISSYDWNDIWIKEGGATWCEALWYYKRFNEMEGAYLNTMRTAARTYLNYPEIYNVPIYGNSPDIFFSVPYVFLTYQKASWVYHQLHYHIGQEKNLDIIQKLLKKYGYKNVNAEDFIQMYRDELKDYSIDFDINKFFDQWLFGAGHPIYDCQAVRTLENETDSTWNVHITLTQTQEGSNIPEVFETPIWIVFLRGSVEVHNERVFNNQKIQEYNFYDIPNFTTCRVDSTRTLTQTPTSSITSIKYTDIDAMFVYPNPAINQKFIYISGVENIGFPFVNDIISITNSFGMEQICSSNRLDNSIQIDISDLASGIYFIKYNGNAFKFSVIR